MNCYICSIALYGAGTKTIRKVDTWEIVKCGAGDHVRNEVLQRVKEEKSILQTIKGRKEGLLIGHILLRSCLSKTHY